MPIATYVSSGLHMVPFSGLQAQRKVLGPRIESAIQRVVDHGQFILGPEVARLEASLAEYTGARHVVTCSSGTDALSLVLMSKGVKPGDGIFCPSFTFCATAEVVCRAGAMPVFVDVDEATFNMSPASLESAIGDAKRLGLEPTGIIAVDLFGVPADYTSINEIARKNGIWVLADAAQSFGARSDGRRVGSLAASSATSFFPSKPLGCYGDGGAIFTDDDDLAQEILLRRVHGQTQDRQNSVRLGMTARLDSIQAAVLLEKLTLLNQELEERQTVADYYAKELCDICIVPSPAKNIRSAWAQYTVRIGGHSRDQVADYLKARGIPTAVHYRRPLHRQTAYEMFPTPRGGLPVTDRLSAEVLSLPMHPYLTPSDLQAVTSSVRSAIESCRAT